MPDNNLRSKNWKAHIIIIFLGLLSDQITKIWAVKEFSFPTGRINYQHTIQVIGEWVQFRLVYNSGAAFGLQPQKLIAFLHPTLFYGIISLIAITILFFFYRNLPARETWTQIGVCLIIAGAFGNIIDRFRLHKVVDFIDAGIPGFDPRWPTFNVADSMVCIGVGIILITPLFQRKKTS
ncbi:signal peptidase II [Fibrobacterota bacterium]